MHEVAVDAPSGGLASAAPAKPLHHHGIDGLRAVAVLLVVLFHAEIPGFGQGYLGVDMFLGISGFLITTRLTSVVGAGHLTPLREFWAARARRIIPAVTLMIVVTCAVSAVVLAPQELGSIGTYGLASNLFVMNIVAAARGGNYFAGPLTESPFLHMWSLGVEEQFYIFLPLLLGPVMLAARRAATALRPAWTPRRVMALVLGATTAASFLCQVVLARTSPLWAFYGLPARMYEFLLGGFAALLVTDRMSTRWRRPATVLGAVALLVAVVGPWGQGTSPALMLAATFGTVAVIVGTAPGRPGAATTPVLQPWLESAPMATVGRWSYSWYLWHWPAFVLVLAATNQALSWARVACLASIVPAALTYRFVEQPFRLSSSLRRSWRRSLLVGAAFVAVGSACCLLLIAWGRIGMRSPEISRIVAAEESFPITGCRPSNRFGPEVCLGGSTDPDAPVVLVVGDSHAGQWADAYSEAGRKHGFTVAIRSFPACAAAGIRPSHAGQIQANLDACTDFQAATNKLIDRNRFAAVILSSATGSRPVNPETWRRDADALISRVKDKGVPVGFMVDNPAMGDVLRCVARGHGNACLVPRSDATSAERRYEGAVRRLERDHGVRVLDLSSEVCPRSPCPLEVDGVIVASRDDHLNRAFTMTQVPALSSYVESLIGR